MGWKSSVGAHAQLQAQRAQDTHSYATAATTAWTAFTYVSTIFTVSHGIGEKEFVCPVCDRAFGVRGARSFFGTQLTLTPQVASNLRRHQGHFVRYERALTS